MADRKTYTQDGRKYMLRMNGLDAIEVMRGDRSVGQVTISSETNDGVNYVAMGRWFSDTGEEWTFPKFLGPEAALKEVCNQAAMHEDQEHMLQSLFAGLEDEKEEEDNGG